jgi:hypothetical protein
MPRLPRSPTRRSAVLRVGRTHRTAAGGPGGRPRRSGRAPIEKADTRIGSVSLPVPTSRT